LQIARPTRVSRRLQEPTKLFSEDERVAKKKAAKKGVKKATKKSTKKKGAKKAAKKK
jgi:hypothetical protein